MSLRPFFELDPRAYAGATVIVDVDGTLTHDKGEPDAAALEKLKRLGEIANVHLCSNGANGRVQTLAQAAGVSAIDSIHRKPSRRVLEKLVHEGTRLVVIGDKALTDGLFALNIGAGFVPVARLRHAGDTRLIRSTYMLDDAAAVFVRILFPVLPYVILMRPFQWIKNLLVIAPIFFAGEVLEPAVFVRSLLAVLVFCAVSSAMYVFNDIRDAARDRLHPSKRYRPVASFAVPEWHAWILLGSLLAVSAVLLSLVAPIWPIMLAYVTGNILYSTYLKHVAVLDLASVAFFYVLRILAGGAATATFVSPWIILCVLFGALFLVIGKRRAEFSHTAKRAVLHLYSQSALDYLLAIAATLTLTSYGLYSVLGDRSPYAVYSTFFVFIVIFRLLNRMYRSDGDAESPESLVFKDRWVLLTSFFWVVFMFILFYLKP